MRNKNTIGVLILIVGFVGSSYAGFKDTLKAAGAAAGGIVNGSAGTGEVAQPPPVAQNTKPNLSQLSVEKSQQQIDKAAESNLFTLETPNAQEVFQALISVRGLDLDQVPEETLAVFKKQLSENEKLLAIRPVSLYGTLFFSDKNVYAASVVEGRRAFSPRNGILRIPYGVFAQLGACDDHAGPEWTSAVNIGGEPIIASEMADFMDYLLQALLETKQIVEACENLDVRNVAIKTLPDITDLSGMCGVSVGATYESIKAAIKPDLAVNFSEVCLEKKLVDPILKVRRLPGIEEAGIPFDGELKQFTYSDITIGSYSFNFVDGRLYFILRDIPGQFAFGTEKMSPHEGSNNSGSPLAIIGNKFDDKHPLILTSMKKYGEPVLLRGVDGRKNFRLQWENENGVLFVDFLKGFDEVIKVFDDPNQVARNVFRYTVAQKRGLNGGAISADEEGRGRQRAQDRQRQMEQDRARRMAKNSGGDEGTIRYPVNSSGDVFEIYGAGYGTVSSEKVANFPRYIDGQEFDYNLATMPPSLAEGQKRYFIAISEDFISPSSAAAKKEVEDSVKLIDKMGTAYKPIHVATVGAEISVFCFNLPKELTVFAAQVGAYNIGLEPDGSGYYFIAPVDWGSLEKQNPKIGMVMYYSKAVRDYVLGKKEAAAKEGEQLKQQEIKSAEKALNF